MPIGDLLAQIGGSGPQSSPAPRSDLSSRFPIAPVKRKATDDLRGDAPKTTRTEASAPSGYKGTANLSRPPVAGPPSAAKPISASARPLNGAKPASSKPAPGPGTRPAAAAPPAKAGPPKKGSYAEILARAQRAQTSMGQVGKIQHKVTEKGATRKDREEVKPAARAPAGKTVPGKTLPGRTGTSAQAARPGYTGTARPSQAAPVRSNGTNRSAAVPNGAKSGVPARAGASAKSKAAAVEETKKIKRAATATTGYTGTARPAPSTARPGAKRPGAAVTGLPRFTAPSRRRRREEEEDEDMDDFIDYDDDEEEDPYANRYRYDSGSESDMEAGMDDIYDEERQAERQARLEDAREQALEAKLKAEKEERKRRFLEEQRGRR